MNHLLVILLAMLVFTITPVRCGEITEKEDLNRKLKFSLTGGERGKILVDNVNGSVDVKGSDGSTVEVIVHKSIKAESKRKMEEAKREITIDMKEDGDRIVIYVDGPWRKSNGSCEYRGYEYDGYEVTCDFEIILPRKTDVTLKTVNSGTVSVAGIEGDFDVSNVNGSVKLRDVSGSGDAHTVNGNIKAEFSKNPSGQSSFKTINGKVDVTFQDNLNADLEFKTLNGEVYSDFDVQSLPQKSYSTKKRHGMKTYKSHDSFSVRVGNGGPELTFNTLNGNIYVSKSE